MIHIQGDRLRVAGPGFRSNLPGLPRKRLKTFFSARGDDVNGCRTAQYFTKEDQAKEVASLIQSNNDLCAEYLRIKRSIGYTNLKVTVELQGKAYSISDLLVVKRKLADRMVATYRALNDTVARDRLRNAPKFDGETPKVEVLYDERKNWIVSESGRIWPI